MKYLLGSIFLLLVLATVADQLSRRSETSDLPVLYWVTDANPAREAQILRFYDWLEENDYPRFRIHLDNSNSDASKKLIQGISGVGADLIHMARDEAWLLQATGMLEDLTPIAAKHHITPDATWPGLESAVLIGGQQVGFPPAVNAQNFYLNVDLFEEFDQPLPPEQWTIDEFEAAGKAFIAAANPPGERQQIFFVDTVNMVSLRRSMGRSMFNETMTRCTLDTPESVRAHALLYKWMHVDHIIPTHADLDFLASSDTVTSRNQLFVQRRYALLTGARYSLVQLRDYPDLHLAVRAAPHDHFPNVLLGASSVGIYKASKHKELAAYFLEFFTSEAYNMGIIQSSDATPPIPYFTTTEAYLRPPDRPNEWNLHGKLADLLTIAIPLSASPFILPTTASRIEREFRYSMLADVYTAKEAMALAEQFINRQIDLNVEADPVLRAHFKQLLKDQATIEALRAAGKPVPLELITNPFYRRYYVAQGWAVGEGGP